MAVLSLVLFSQKAFAQIPDGYYDTAEGVEGYELKTALHDIIKEHDSLSYGDLWTFYADYELDVYYENDGTILDIYSENPDGDDPYNYEKEVDQCGNFSVEGDCYNREHSMPRSWFDEAEPMNSDVHHVFPTDGDVNGERGSLPYGIVGTATYTSMNGSQKGTAVDGLGYSGEVFEPIDEFKGDLARAYFYVATRYQDRIAIWAGDVTETEAVVLDGSSDQVFQDWVVEMLLDWHEQDPVSQKELDRNEAAFIYQGNRNPFVDNPAWASCVWTNDCDTLNFSVSEESLANFGPLDSAELSEPQSYIVTGSGLEEYINITVTEGFEISLDTVTYTDAITIEGDTTDGFDSTFTVYVRFAPDTGEPGVRTGQVTNSVGAFQEVVLLEGIETTPDEGKTEATVTLSNLTQTYDGSPKSITVLTDPAGLASYVLYDGAADPPTDAGTYQVEAFVNHVGYTGSATGTFVIEEEDVVAGLLDGRSEDFEVYQRFGGKSITISDKKSNPTRQSVVLLDIRGEIVGEYEFLQKTTLNLTGCQPGIYLIRIVNEYSNFYKKIMILED